MSEHDHPGDAIRAFRGQWGFLSNFHASPLVYEGMTYPTVEHGFQAAKTHDVAERARIAAAATPSLAKRLGRRVALRPDWEQVKEGVMGDLLAIKFAPRTVMADGLLDTGERVLVEGNDWGDRYWGVCGGSGLNRLGVLLMEQRDRLRALSLDRIPAPVARHPAG
jgi:ribA/ribD-fused uncharacterized protein